MSRFLYIAIPAVLLGAVGLWLGYYAKGTTTGMIIAALAGLLGGGIAGSALQPVVERVRTLGLKGV
jgi:outer membrane lipoprotein SlyB